MNIFESILMALEAVKANKLRSILTLLSIAIGIFAIIGAGTAVTSLNSSVSTQLASLGQNTFTIDRIPHIITSEEEWMRVRKRKPITYAQAQEFKERLAVENVSITNAMSGQIVKVGNLSTNPNVQIMGADNPYFDLNSQEIAEGRALSDEDILISRKVAVIGKDIEEKLFSNGQALGKEVRIRSTDFLVVGILKSKGTVLGHSLDNIVVIPISFYMHSFANENDRSVTLDVKAYSQASLPATVDRSIGCMRTMRNVQPGDDNDFEIITNESLTDQFENFTKYIGMFGSIAGWIALIAAGVGIMNIMLVSVKERTREIGIRKAVGAKRSAILLQFIIEAITLCQLGGVIGMGMGLLGGVGLSALMQTTLALPWGWIIFSILLCTLLGVIFGSYPAWKASQLDPIETLRYE